MSNHSHKSDSLEALPAHWVGVEVNLDALRDIICQVFRISIDQCGPAVELGHQVDLTYARVYSFQLPTQKIVARTIAPVTPVFKTESEIAAMDFVRKYTSLPVPKVFAYSSVAGNPVGVEWILMEHASGQELENVWDQLDYQKKERLARDLVDIYDQLSRLKGPGIGSIYHNVDAVDDYNPSKSPRWMPLSADLLTKLRAYCKIPIKDGYRLGPLNDVSLINILEKAPPYSQTLPVFTSEEYVELVAHRGNPPTRDLQYDIPTRDKCVTLFKSIFSLYSHSDALGSSSDARSICFSHGDLHAGNIFIDPETGAITGLIDWECAGFRPLWSHVSGVGWFDEDSDRIIFGSDDANNFEGDAPSDAKLRAYFRRALQERNPHLFSAFSGFELRAVVQAAGDNWRTLADIFLTKYHRLGYWNERRRGPFPWEMVQWVRKRCVLDLMEDGQVEQAKALEMAGL